MNVLLITLPEILKNNRINYSACKAAAKIELFGQLVHFPAGGVLRNQKLESAEVEKEVDV
jgi:hypothetical protein